MLPYKVKSFKACLHYKCLSAWRKPVPILWCIRKWLKRWQPKTGHAVLYNTLLISVLSCLPQAAPQYVNFCVASEAQMVRCLQGQGLHLFIVDKVWVDNSKMHTVNNVTQFYFPTRSSACCQKHSSFAKGLFVQMLQHNCLCFSGLHMFENVKSVQWELSHFLKSSWGLHLWMKVSTN